MFYRVSLIAVLDLLVMVSASLFGLAVAIMIVIGRKQTCNAIKDMDSAQSEYVTDYPIANSFCGTK